MSGPLSLRRCGDRAVLIETGDNRRALGLATAVRASLGAAVEDVVPGHETVLVTWPAGGTDPHAELAELLAEPGDDAPLDAAEPVEVRVRYDGPDLDAVAAHAGLTRGEVAAAHAAASYRVAFVGYAPGFGYMLGGDPRLEVPRRPEPRARIAAGSVALAGPYTAVYPNDAPGGWQLIGSTEERMFDLDREPPSRIVPGAQVRFRAVA